MDILDVTRYIAGLVLVLGLLAGFAIILRRGYAQGLFPGLPGQVSRRRMKITESLMLDPRRRVVILQIDDVEQVLLLGAGQELVLDTRPAPPAFEPVMPGEVAEPPAKPARQASTGRSRASAKKRPAGTSP